MLFLNVSSLFGYPKIKSYHQTGPDESEAACRTLKMFEESLRFSLSREDGPMCMDSQPRSKAIYHV